MKRRFLIWAFFLAPIVTNAQSIDNRPVELGFTASPNFGWISSASGQSPQIEGEGLRTGFIYGLLADFPFAENYYFATALTLSTLNARASQQSNQLIYKLQYVEIPLTIKLKSNEIANRRFYGQFGLATGVAIGSKQDISFQNSSTPAQKNIDISGSVNTLRAGLLIGGGAEWNTGENLKLLTGISYSNGFTNIFEGDAKTRNSYVAINLGIFF